MENDFLNVFVESCEAGALIVGIGDGANNNYRKLKYRVELKYSNK